MKLSIKILEANQGRWTVTRKGSAVAQGWLRLIDSFFRIVLEPRPDTVSLGVIIAPMTEGRLAGWLTFVVGEQIEGPETVITELPPQCGQPASRAVISFDGRHQPTSKVLDSNAFISDPITTQLQAGPILKAFSLPWNRWHSFKFDAHYFKAGSPLTWDIASDPRLQPRTGQAETLEQQIIRCPLMRFTGR